MAEGTKVEDLMGSLNGFMNSLRTNEEEERDENGNVVASRILDAQGNVLFSHQYTYDESGRRLSHDSFKDGKLKSREESSYDENGFKTTKYFNGDNVPQRIVRLDDQGRQVGAAQYDLHGNLESFSSQTYKENGEENETVSYEISNGKIRITSQSFCDDNGTRHIRSYRNDEVQMSYQTKDLRFPNQVWVPTKDDWSRDRAAAEKYLNDYKAEEAFFKSKPEPKMDAWVASFGEPEKSPVKEEQKAEIAEEVKQAESENRKKDRQMTDSEGYNHLVSYDDDGRVSADKKFDKDGNLIGEGIYENGEFKGSKAYFVDDKGFSHVAVKDVQDRPVSDQRFDKDGNLVGEGIYEKGEFKGSKVYFVDNEGFSHVAVKDVQDRPVSDQRFDKDGKLVGEGVYEKGEFKGSKAYFVDNEGFSHVAVKDELDRPVSDQKFEKDGKLAGEGIYEKGEFKGSKVYFVDNEGFSHVAVKDVKDRPVSDQKFDKDGKLAGEGIYENGEFKGSKAYFVDNEGFSHVAVKDELDRPVSDQKFDKDGKLAGEGIYENGEFKGSKAYVVKDGVEQVVEYDVNDNVITPAPEKQAEKQTEPVQEERKAESAEEVKQAEPEKTVEKYNQYVDAAGYSHFVTRDENGQMLADESFDKDGNTQSASYYKNGVLDSKTIYNEDGSRHSFFYEDDGSVRSEKLVSADGRSVSSIAHTGGMTTTELLDEQGRTAYTVSYYNDGGKLYPWNEHSYAYDADGKQIDDQVRSFGIDGEKGGKTSEELLASLQHKDEWLMQTFADRVSGRVTAEEAQKTAGVVSTVEEKQAEPVQEERKAEPAEEVKQAEPVQEERKAEPVEEVKQAEPEKQAEQQAEQVAESDAYVNMITPASEERDEKQAEQAAESDAYVNMITPASEERDEQQAEQAAETDTYVNTITSGSEEQEEKQPDQVYDEDGRLSEQTLYNGLGRVYGSVSYVYSDDGSTSMYTYDTDGQQTGFDSYDAEGHRKFAADFSNGVQQNFVRFDDEGRPTNIELYNEGQPAFSTSIQYDGDAVYKDVRSADGQLLRSETTRDGRMSIVDYVDQKARTFSFNTIGSLDSFTDYAIQDGKAVKVKDGKSDFLWGEKEARFYDSDGRITEGFIRDSDGVVTSYSFSKNGSYKESGPNGDKTHHAIRLFGKNVHTPQMPEFSENTTDEIPLVVDGDNHPQLSEQELACFRQGYNEIDKNKRTVRDYAEQALCIVNGSSRIELFAQAADRLTEIDGIKREVPNREVLMSNKDTLKNAEERAAAEAQNNSGAEQSFANTQQNSGAEQTADNRANDAGERDAEQQTQPVGNDRVVSEWEKAVNENRDEQVCTAENGDERNTSRGLGESDLMKQSENLRQWINYFGMEGSRAKPPYASPFEKITTCRNVNGLALADLKNGNSLINSENRMELVIRSKEGEKKEPTLDECMTLVRLGQQKGWTSIRISGSPAFQKQMYLACRSLGMPTKDFVPTPEMLKEGADLESAFNSKDKLLPQSAEDKEAGKPEMREPMLTERCADLDGRFYALEKIRKAQPAREATAEDPYPDMANFDTIRAAEKQGIRPLTAVEKEPDDLDGKLNVLNKRSNDALDNLMQTEKNRKETLLHTAQETQRGEWRSQLAAVEQKEQSGQSLSDADIRVKAMADKYQINSDAAKEPEKVPVIDRADFDQTTEKALRKKEIGVEVGSAFAAAVVRREAAVNTAALISGSSEIPSTKDLLSTAKKELKQIAGEHQPISETLRQIGNINAQTVQQTEQNKKNYSGATKRKMRDNRQASEASKKLDARVVAAASQRNGR